MKRKPRADAQRNREHILKIAKDAFMTVGSNASLDDIAKKANVGAGTLYRHFPTREALLEEVYRAEVQKLASAEKEFALSMSPIEALRAWLLLFVEYIAAKRVVSEALQANKMMETSGNKIKEAIQSLVDRAVESGDIRRDLDPIDLLRAIFGVSSIANEPNWQDSAKRLVDILIAGSKPTL